MTSNKYWIARGKRIRSYGITTDEYKRLLSEQNDGCAICGGVNKDMALCIDHDHNSGDVRGLLCHRCNRAIGLLQDRPDLMIKAAEYLRRGIPQFLQGKLIVRFGKKVRVPYDYVEKHVQVSEDFNDLVDVLNKENKTRRSEQDL